MHYCNINVFSKSMLVDIFCVHAPMHTWMDNILYKPPPLIQAFLSHILEIVLYLGMCVKWYIWLFLFHSPNLLHDWIFQIGQSFQEFLCISGTAPDIFERGNLFNVFQSLYINIFCYPPFVVFHPLTHFARNFPYSFAKSAYSEVMQSTCFWIILFIRMRLSTRYVVTNELRKLFKGLYFFSEKGNPIGPIIQLVVKSKYTRTYEDILFYYLILITWAAYIWKLTHHCQKMHFTIMIFFTGQKFYFSLTRCTLSSHYVNFLKHNLLPRYSVRMIEYNGETQLPLLYFNISAYKRHSTFCELRSQ